MESMYPVLVFIMSLTILFITLNNHRNTIKLQSLLDEERKSYDDIINNYKQTIENQRNIIAKLEKAIEEKE